MERNTEEENFMNNPIEDLAKYRKFLENIPLDKYREELINVKWVEQDLPKEILPLASIFKHCWENRGEKARVCELLNRVMT